MLSIKTDLNLKSRFAAQQSDDFHLAERFLRDPPTATSRRTSGAPARV